MRSLKARGSFVGDSYVHTRHMKRDVSEILSIILIFIISISVIAITVFDPVILIGKTATNTRAPLGFGITAKNPRVCYGDGVFLVATINASGYVNVTAVNSTSGINITAPLTVTTNATTTGRVCIAYSPVDDVFILVWKNTSSYILGSFIQVNGNTLTSSGCFIINDTSVGLTSFGLAYGASKFFVVWSDTSNDNYGRFVYYNLTDPTPQPSFLISPDTSHSHAKNAVAYDPFSQEFIVVWRNTTSTTGIYNITARIFNDTGAPLTPDFTVADGASTGAAFDYPEVSAGSGVFFITYVNASGTYPIYASFLNSTGAVTLTEQIGTTGSTGISYPNSAFDGKDFVVTWVETVGLAYDVFSAVYYPNGSAATAAPVDITNTADSERTPDVAADTINGTYYYVWYDYSNSKTYGVVQQKSYIVPEFILPVAIISLIFVIVVFKKAHK